MLLLDSLGCRNRGSWLETSHCQIFCVTIHCDPCLSLGRVCNSGVLKEQRNRIEPTEKL
ncbi:hypothetical protein RB6037 [Rhodopirellula baltica SH 1]|uniref:Uncharacterized protein n=1 Tax=Rhodopirellula baltica (strain DSM 10527 / NCIMB 13988 / SH1) TaxID=243090 RepID=Q7UQW8_RHOBA|nr:hypothetical protein RB6037 [Rhodopirellula baltica SH 1]